MKTTRIAPLSVLSVVVIAAAAHVLPPRASAQEGMDPAGPVHQALAKLAGQFDVVTKFQTAPGEKPEETKGTATLKSVCDGKFLVEDNTGSMMGTPITGWRLLGYNNVTQSYEASWVYSMATSILHMKGKSDDGGKTVKLSGDMEEGGEKMTLRVEYHFASPDKFVVKMFGGPTDEGGPMLEETYVRKK